MTTILKLEQPQNSKKPQWEQPGCCLAPATNATMPKKSIREDANPPLLNHHSFSFDSFSKMTASCTTSCTSTSIASNSPNYPPRKPHNIGILAMEICFPHQYVEQKDLELYDEVSPGKYTEGLGQQRMAVPTPAEDVASLSLSAVERLLVRYSLDPRLIGRLEVGSESILDKSKSIKSIIMQLFEPCGNTEILGVDNINACYGGTAALLNSICWLESSLWDGRFAIVVAADIAVYAKGNARATGGAGAVAILLGPNAPLVMESPFTATHMRHVWDFYKPDLASEYPVVEGKYSIECYLDSLEKTFSKFSSRLSAAYAEKQEQQQAEGENNLFGEIDFFALHCPYVKLAKKGASRLFGMIAPAEQNESEFFKAKVLPGLTCASQIGNMYCASVYASIISILTYVDCSALEGKRIGVFSYGSGLASSFFSLKIASESGVRFIARTVDLHQRLGKRRAISPESFSLILQQREHFYQKKNFTNSSFLPCIEESPKEPNEEEFNSCTCFDEPTYYLACVDEKGKRTYEKHSFQFSSFSSQ